MDTVIIDRRFAAQCEVSAFASLRPVHPPNGMDRSAFGL
jgi:hypothetical protein